MLVLPISRSWLFSKTAQRAYLVAALLVIAWFGTRIAIHAAMSSAGRTELSTSAALLVRVLLYPEIVGSALLWVGMLYFSFDQTDFMKRAVWFLILVLIPFAAVFYYYFVYRRCQSHLPRQNGSQSQEPARISP